MGGLTIELLFLDVFWIIKPVITAQKQLIRNKRPLGAKSKIFIFFFLLSVIDATVHSVLSFQLGHIFWKLTVLIKEAEDSHKKKNQQRTSEQNAVCWFRHFILLSVDAARSPPPANSAGAHQRQWNYRESLHAAAMKHSHGEKSLCAKHRYSGIRGLSMLSWRTVIEMVC